MAKYKAFNVHDLYPADYVFPWDKFESDPDGYQFTSEDIAYTNAMELEKYELKTPMTPCEKQALRRWVASGHSVREAPPSKYPCAYPSHLSPDFLDVYRIDKELDAATKGMSKEQKLAYLQEHTGCSAETLAERQKREENELLYKQTPEAAREKIRMLQRQLCYIWIFLSQEGLYEDADAFVKNHMDEPTPFENEW